MTTRKTNRLQEVTEEEIKLINPENIKMLKKFIRYIKATDLSPATIKVYRSNLIIFFNWLRENEDNKDLSEVDETDILMFQGWCMERDMSSSRIRNLRSSISSISDFILKTEKHKNPKFAEFDNYVKFVDAPPQVYVREKTVLSEEEVQFLLKELINQKKYQIACCVATMVSSGMRVSEVIQTRVDWVRGDEVKEASGMYISPPIRTKGAGKRGKIMEKFLIKELLDPYLDLWLEERKEMGITNPELFVRKINGEWQPVQQSTVQSWMNTCSKIVGKVIYAHAFRHFISTWLKRNGAEVSEIKDFHGHEGVATTELYIDIDRSENLKDMLSFMNK